MDEFGKHGHSPVPLRRHANFGAEVYEGDFCHSLPASASRHAPRNQEEKMKIMSSSTSGSSARSAVRRSRNATQPDTPSSACNCPREQMIAEAAYFRAERRGFEPGNEMADWLEAEADVEHLINEGQ